MFWFDLDNSPHVPLFRPIFAELNKQQIPYLVTARDFAQTRDLLCLWNIEHTLIGQHGGKNKFKKILNLVTRSQELMHFVKGKDISLAVSHGSRTQVVTAWRSAIRSVLMLDYEYTEKSIFNMLATVLLMPALIPNKRLSDAGFNLKKVVRYNGFKEEIYLKDFVPNSMFRSSINIDNKKILVTLRPPATLGNYHDEKSEGLFLKCLEYFSSFPDVHCLVVNRTTSNKNVLPKQLSQKDNISFLSHAVDGLQLIWNSDIVVSGGGTMNRESALLGVPTYSIFTGKKPYLDEYLKENGKLTFIENVNGIEHIPVEKRSATHPLRSINRELASQITEIIIELNRK